MLSNRVQVAAAHCIRVVVAIATYLPTFRQAAGRHAIILPREHHGQPAGNQPDAGPRPHHRPGAQRQGRAGLDRRRPARQPFGGFPDRLRAGRQGGREQQHDEDERSDAMHDCSESAAEGPKHGAPAGRVNQPARS